jgi:hypothetical protein
MITTTPTNRKLPNPNNGQSTPRQNGVWKQEINTFGVNLACELMQTPSFLALQNCGEMYITRKPTIVLMDYTLVIVELRKE